MDYGFVDVQICEGQACGRGCVDLVVWDFRGVDGAVVDRGHVDVVTSKMRGVDVVNKNNTLIMQLLNNYIKTYVSLDDAPPTTPSNHKQTQVMKISNHELTNDLEPILCQLTRKVSC